MALKKYTLYFKGKNKFGNEHNLKLISLDLKSMDEYTVHFENYVNLFKNLTEEIKKYIKENLSYTIDLEKEEDLSKCFFITDGDFNPIMDVIFDDDKDVLYITLKELQDLVIKEKMSYEEVRNSMLKCFEKSNCSNKYEFFKYLYETYVKDQKIACMIDTYDVEKEFFNVSLDERMIISIATDKDNIMVLCKKLGQALESRRNLALKFKKLFKEIRTEDAKMISFSSSSERKKNLNKDVFFEDMILNLNVFKKKYDKEYNI